MQTSEAIANLERVTKTPLLDSLGKLFSEAGFELALVGGPVRDAFLGRVAPDIDLTTNATPDEILKVDVLLSAQKIDLSKLADFCFIAMLSSGNC
jgi:poly(A) polymerase